MGELLVVLAIVAVLAAILFPIFANARAAAKKAVALSNFRQGVAAVLMYASDYDDGMPPSAYDMRSAALAATDRKWPQLISPYVSAFSVFLSPADPNARANDPTVFDPDIVPNDPASRFYAAAQRVNMGYNHRYLSPVIESFDELPTRPINLSEVAAFSRTLAFVESVYEVNDAGVPQGGGSYIVDPPCRYVAQGGGSGVTDTFPSAGATAEHSPEASMPSTPGWGGRNGQMYGYAWPWHQGRMAVAFLDGSAQTLSPVQLAKGCDAKPAWSGFIFDRGTYAWDLD